MRIGEPARKHGIPDTDIRHAVRHAVCWVGSEEGFTMVIGPAGNGNLLEVGILDLGSDDPVAIHAMTLRPQFRRFLNR